MPKVPSSGSYTNSSSQKKNTSIQKNINQNKFIDSSKGSTNKKKSNIINSNSMNNNKKKKDIIDQYSSSINNNKKTHTKIPSTNTNSELTTNLKQQTSTNSHYHLYNQNNDYTKNSNNPNNNNKAKGSNQDLINRLKDKNSSLKFSITSKNYYINIKNKNQNVNSFQLEEEPYDKNKKKFKGNQDNITKGINIMSKFDTFVQEVKYMQKDKNKFNKTSFNYYFDKKKNLKNTKSFDINKNNNKDKKHFIVYQGKNKEKQDIICVDKTELINKNCEIKNYTNKENDKNKMNIICITKEQNEINVDSHKDNIAEDTCHINKKNKSKKDVIKSKDKDKVIKEKDLKIKEKKDSHIISDLKENINTDLNNNKNENEKGNKLIEKKMEKETKKDEYKNIKEENDKEKEKSQRLEKDKKAEPEKPKIITKNDNNHEKEKKDEKEKKNKEKEEKEENKNKNELNNIENEKKEKKNEKKEQKNEEKEKNKENKDENNKIKKEEEIKYKSPVKKNKSKKKKKTRDYSSTPIIIQFKPLSPKNNIEKSDPDDSLPIYFTISSITNAQIPKDYLNIIYYNLLIEEKENRKQFKAEYNYMNNQKEINEQMRSILVDWIIDVHGKFGFCDETLYMTVSIIDRYSSIKKITRNEYQCLGITALMISCKHEEINVPKVEDFIYITDNAYNKEEVFNMEIDILDKLNYNLLYPSPIKFYEYLSLHFGFDKKKHYLGKYLMETFLLDLPYIKFKSSIISCACVYIVMKFFKMKNYKESYAKKWYMIEGKEGYEIESGCGVKDCAQELCNFTDNINNTNYLSCQKKYATDEYCNISKLIFNSPDNKTKNDEDKTKA